MPDAMNGLLIRDLRGRWQGPLSTFRKQTAAITYREYSIIASGLQIGSNDDLPRPIELKATGVEDLRSADTGGPHLHVRVHGRALLIKRMSVFAGQSQRSLQPTVLTI